MDRRLVNFAGMVLTWVILLWLAETPLSQTAMMVIAVAGILVLIPIILISRRLLDREPTIEKAQEVTTLVHYAVAILLGSSVVAATRFTLEEPVWQLALPPWLGLLLVVISSILLLAVVLNLALKGLGAPFAVALTRMVAAEWFYAWTRNPMILSALLLLAGIGLWLQSGLYLLWLLLFVFPATLIFIAFYEERELEIRFGQSYLDYKDRTPRLFPWRRK